MFNKQIVLLQKNWMIIASFFGGFLLLFISVELDEAVNSNIKLVRDVCYTVGGVLLGSAVFGSIMKGGMLGDILQEHIAKSFYDPANIKKQEVVVERWELLTKAMLTKVLPYDYDSAVNRLKDDFFNSELHYHYEDFSIRYDLNIDDEAGIATISSVLTARVVKSPGAKNPVLIHRIDTNGAASLNEVFQINGRKVDPELNEENGVYEYSILLNNYPESINIQRVGTRTQDLNVDPTIVWNVMRYTKGASITVIISAGSKYKATFTEVGLTKLPKDYEQKISQNETTWIIAETGHLLLPGHGCTIVLTK